MLPQSFVDALIVIARRLHAAKIEWAVIGSSSLALFGMDMTPNDLDISVHFNDLKKIPALFSDCYSTGVVELKTTTQTRAWHVKLTLKDAPVEFVGEEDTGLYVRHLIRKEITFAHADAVSVPCLSLEANALAYAATNRKEKAERVWAFVKQTRK